MNEWVEATDTCPICGGKARVMVKYVADDGDHGHVIVQKTHMPDCPDAADTNNPSLVEVVEEYDDFAGWEYAEELRLRLGVNPEILVPFSDITHIRICSICDRFIVYDSLVIFPSSMAFEVNLCNSCAERLEVLKMVV